MTNNHIDRTDILTKPDTPQPMASKTGDAVEWLISDRQIPYPEAIAFMEQRIAAIARGEAKECVWLLEHPPLYTAGTSADPRDLVAPDRFDVCSKPGAAANIPITAPANASHM